MSTIKDIFRNNDKLKVEKVQETKTPEIFKPLFEKHNEKKFLEN